MLRRVLSTGKVAILVLPYVSICAGKAEHLEVLLESLDKHVRNYYGNQGGGTLPKDTSVDVCTIENANSLINRLLEEGRLSEIGIIVIDELHMDYSKFGVQVIVETNGSLAMVEDETPKAVTLTPPSYNQNPSSYNQYPPSSTYDPPPPTLQFLPVSQAIRAPSPSAPQNGLGFIHHQWLNATTTPISQFQQYLPVYAPASHNQFEPCGYVLKPLYPPEYDSVLLKENPDVSSFPLLPARFSEFTRQFHQSTVVVPFTDKSLVTSSSNSRVPVDPHVAILMEQVKRMQEKLDLMMSNSTPSTQDIEPGKEVILPCKIQMPEVRESDRTTCPGTRLANASSKLEKDLKTLLV